MRNVLDECGSHGSGEKGASYACILKVSVTGFANGLDMVSNRMRDVQCLSHWRIRVAISRDWEDAGGIGLGGNIWNSLLTILDLRYM